MLRIKVILPLITACIIINSYAFASQDSKNILDNVYLIRNPSFVEACEPKIDADAILIIRPQKKFDNKDRIYIITHTQGVIDATLEHVLDGCEPFFEKDKGDLGLLHSQKKIQWFLEIDALIAVSGTGLPKMSTGIVKPYSLDKRKTLFIKEIRKYIPKSDHVGVDNVLQFVLPGRKAEYVFIGISHFDEEEYKKAGDKVLKMKGFLFIVHNGIPKLLIEEDNLTNVFTVSDLLGDGLYEILVHTGTAYGGSYELRFFDGQKFTKDKIILYEWMD